MDEVSILLTAGDKYRRFNRMNFHGVDQLKITITFIDEDKIKRLNNIRAAENEFRYNDGISKGKKGK